MPKIDRVRRDEVEELRKLCIVLAKECIALRELLIKILDARGGSIK